MANVCEGNIMTTAKRKGKQRNVPVQEAHLLSMEQTVLEKVLSFVVTPQVVDSATLFAVRLTCKQLRGIADLPMIWQLCPVATERRVINFYPLKFLSVKCTGTEGTCTKVVHKGTGEEYALKKSRPFPNEDGVPYHLVRELSTLKALAHRNIAPLLGASLQQGRMPCFYTLFPFVQHTLQEVLLGSGVASTPRGLPHAHAMDLAAQLLQAVRHCHAHGVLHRNIKPKHILVRLRGSHGDAAAPGQAGSSTPRCSHQYAHTAAGPLSRSFDLNGAQLLLSDFALLRTVAQPRKTYTGDMFSLWYRPPEVLMGVRAYSENADLWSVGCVVAEMLTGAQLFQGTSQIDQLFQIFSKLGTPTSESWPGFVSTPYYTEWKFPRWEQRSQCLSAHVRTATSAQLDLLGRCLQCCPDRRPSAAQLLEHPALLLQDSTSRSVGHKSTLFTSPAPARTLQTALGWAAAEMGKESFRAYAEARSLRWEQLQVMLQSEGRAQEGQTERDEGAAPLKSLPWYQLLVGVMREVVELRAADDYCPACLHRAVGLLDRYAAAVELCPLLRPGAIRGGDFETCAVDSMAAVDSQGQSELLYSGAATNAALQASDRTEPQPLVPLVLSEEERCAGLRALGLSQAAAEDMLALAACCLQLASKYEDVMYLELTEVQKLAAACLERRLKHRRDAAAQDTCRVGAAPHCTSQFARLSERQASLHALLAACAEVCPRRVMTLEEEVLRALDFRLHQSTVRDFVGLLLEECGGLEKELHWAAAGKDERVSCWLNCNVLALSLPRDDVPWMGDHMSCLREVLGGLVTSHALANAALVAYAPSLVAASTVWLCGRVSLLLSSPALWEEWASAEERVAEQARWEGREGGVERWREAALRGWSGYGTSELFPCVEAIWAELQNYARSAGPESVYVVGPSGEEAPLKAVLADALDANCVLAPLRHRAVSEAQTM